MSEAKETEKGMIAHESGIIVAGIGKIKTRMTMRLVGFADDQAKNMTLYQKVRRKAQQMTVVDKAVPQQIGDGAETVNSTLSSADRTELENASNLVGSRSGSSSDGVSQNSRNVQQSTHTTTLVGQQSFQ